MDWLQFISSIIGSVAWPTVIVVLLILLRKHLGGLADRIEEISFPGGKAKFLAALEKGRETAETLVNITGITRNMSPVGESSVVWTHVDPIEVITEAFGEVQSVLIQLRNVLGLPPQLNLPSIMQHLHTHGFATAATVELFDTLRKARKAAIHVSDKNSITAGEVDEFRYQSRVLADILQGVLDEVKQKPSP